MLCIYNIRMMWKCMLSFFISLNTLHIDDIQHKFMLRMLVHTIPILTCLFLFYFSLFHLFNKNYNQVKLKSNHTKDCSIETLLGAVRKWRPIILRFFDPPSLHHRLLSSDFYTPPPWSKSKYYTPTPLPPYQRLFLEIGSCFDDMKKITAVLFKLSVKVSITYQSKFLTPTPT